MVLMERDADKSKKESFNLLQSEKGQSKMDFKKIAMLGVGVGAYGDSRHVAALREGLVKELDAIAEAKGIDISLADPSSTRGSKVFKRARYSTLQDLDAKRHTEVDMFSGAIIRMGKELGIPTPYNEFAFHMLKALEEKNDGMFDYG